MKLLSRMGIIGAALVIFALFFFIGLSLTQSSVKLVQFVTGISSWEYAVKEQTVVYYSDNTEMGKLGYKREYSEDFPELMKKAVVAVEDRRFYEHNGLDSRGIGRAIWNNIKSGSKSEGGSTITMQLARTLFLGQEKTYIRKIKEVFIATAIEDKYTKDAILNLYLNEIYMGRGCSGMQCAAQSYFGKNVMALNDAEITMLVGLIQSPEYYSPDRNMEALKKRQSIVVDVLVEQELMTAEEGEYIKSQELNIHPFSPYSYNHPYYMAYLSAQLEDIVGAQKLYQGGLKIYTTIDRQMQQAAEKSVTSNFNSFSYRGIDARDAALVSVDPRYGEIKAMVGGVNFADNQLNMCVAARQPGSAIKPLYYAQAMNDGLIQPDMVLNNTPRSFNGYSPKNYGYNNPKTTTVRDALIYSYNVASVEVLNLLGVEKAGDFLEDLGVSSLEKNDCNLALALGGMERGISPLQMAAAYAIFPSGGVYHGYYTIEKIVDEQGKTIYTAETTEKRAIKSNTAEQMDSILKAVVSYGTGTRAAVGIPSGGKTGTTSDSRDLWYMGYTSELVTAVWVGNSDGQVVGGNSTYGGSVAAPIWRDYMNNLIYSGVFEAYPRVDNPQEEETLEEEPQAEEPPVEEETPAEEDSEQPSPDNEDVTEEPIPGDEEENVPPVEPPSVPPTNEQPL